MAWSADISSGMLCASAWRINILGGLPWPKMPGPFFGPSPARALWRVSTGGCRSVWYIKVWHGSVPSAKVAGVRTEPNTSRRTPPLGYCDVWKGANKFKLHTPSVGRSTELSLPCDRGMITNKHSRPTSKYFLNLYSTTAKALFIEENCAKKFDVVLWRPTLLLFIHCVACFFFLGSFSRLHCVGRRIHTTCVHRWMGAFWHIHVFSRVV